MKHNIIILLVLYYLNCIYSYKNVRGNSGFKRHLKNRLFVQPSPALSVEQAESKALGILEDAKKQSLIPEIYIDQLAGFVSGYAHQANDELSAIQYLDMMKGLMHSIGQHATYSFDVYHEAVRTPFDFYEWGKQIWSHLIDFPNSTFSGIGSLREIADKLSQGHNVFLLSNHQIEPDSYIVRIAFERLGFKDLSEKLILIAGHRVRSDPLSIPFSMGCNLLCVHSKKHLENDSPDFANRRQQNLAAMQTLNNLLSSGGKLIWVAPSGGRDRPDSNGIWRVSDFDSKTNKMFRLMAAKSNKPVHFVPMALRSASICPPPEQVNKSLGEYRSCKFSSIGVSFGSILDATNSLSAEAFSSMAQSETEKLYEKL